MNRRKKLNLRTISTIEDKKDDIIRVLNFRAAPVNTTKGKKVTVQMTIKNMTSKNLKRIPWQIGMDKVILHNGIRYNLPAGDSFRVCVTWTAIPGYHFFFGDADPNNTLKEPKIKQYNNLPQGIDIKIK